MKREKIIVRTSIIGILANLILVGFKGAVGFFTGSIAIVIDAINNLTDMISAIVTIIGAKLATKAPDKKHPYGYGRMEYFSSIAVAVIILYAGVMAIKESAEKIIHPTKIEYTAVALLIIAVAVVVKFILGQFVKREGKKIEAHSLVAAGQDALMDGILSLSTLVAAIINCLWQVSLEGYLGLIIGAFIIKAAVDLIREPLSDIIGERADKGLTDEIKKIILGHKEVEGAYDLSLHNYGPEQMIGTVHIQVDDGMKAAQIHSLTRKISEEIFKKFNIVMTVGVYAANDKGEFGKIKRSVEKLVQRYSEIKQLHGFYVNNKKQVFFDLVMDFQAKSPEKIRNEIVTELKRDFPGYDFNIVLDADVSD